MGNEAKGILRVESAGRNGEGERGKSGRGREREKANDTKVGKRRPREEKAQLERNLNVASIAKQNGIVRWVEVQQNTAYYDERKTQKNR